MTLAQRAPAHEKVSNTYGAVPSLAELVETTQLARTHGLACVDLSALDARVFNSPGSVLSEFVSSRSLPALPMRLTDGREVLVIASPEDQAEVQKACRKQGIDCASFVLTTPGSFREARELLRATDARRATCEAKSARTDGPARVSADPQASPIASAGRLEAEPVQAKQGPNDADSASDAPAVRLVNRIIGKAMVQKASDIHFEPYEDSYRVRMRCDGVLVVTETPAPELSQAVAARLKVMARMDISERRLPQDGRIRLSMSDGRQVDMRVNSLPTLWGEKLVLRILGGSGEARSIPELGMTVGQRGQFETALGQSQGLILVTGPTGSGKTVTLYAGLGWLNSNERNILAVEDPVEITLPGINQVQVNTRAGLSFSRALRAFLRQDPDIIMLGEVRDQETAEIAVRAAQTGHIVLATLHTNSALETPGRLIDMGIPPFLLCSALSLVVAQRLVRQLCTKCSLGASDQSPQPTGCNECVGGYSGRRGIYEILRVTPELAAAIAKQAHLDEFAAIAREQGWSSLREEGEKLLREGITSRAELERVCS